MENICSERTVVIYAQ